MRKKNQVVPRAGSLKRQNPVANFILNLFFVLFSAAFLLPLLMIVAVSFSREEDITEHGYRLIPEHFDLTAYKVAFSKPQAIGNAYLITTAFTIVGVVLSLIVMTMLAYTLSRRQFFLHRQLSFLVFFTMLFGGGLVPTYIVNTQLYKLGDSFWIYIFPSLCSVFQIIILRTFFKDLPEPLFESAKIDGASEARIFFNIVLPLSTPAIATIAVMGVLNRWNDWYTAMIYVRNTKLYSLQYLLQKIVLEMNWLIDNFRTLPPGVAEELASGLPMQTTKMAICIIVAGPVLFIFPFFQKYFAQGLTVGAIKG